MTKQKYHPRWGDRKVVKKAPGVVLLERDTIDFVVTYDHDKLVKQKPKFFTFMGNRTRSDAHAAAVKEFKRRQR